MAFEEIQSTGDVESLSNAPATLRRIAAPSVPLAGMYETTARKIHGSNANLNVCNLIDMPSTLAGKAQAIIQYSNSTEKFVFTAPDKTSFNTNGYATIGQTDTSRILLQWGTSSKLTEGTANVTFPIAFSNTPYMILCSGKASDWSTAEFTVSQLITGFSSTGFTWQLQKLNTLDYTNGTYWIAIGPI